MKREEFEDLVISECLGILTQEEQAALDTAAAAHAEFQKIRREYRSAAEALIHLAPAQKVPISLKGRVLAEVAAKQAANTRAGRFILPTSPGWTWQSLAAAACILLFAGLGLFSLGEGQRPVLVQDVRETPGEYVILKPQQSGSPAQARIKWDGTREVWKLEAENLPPLPADKDYQVWIIDPGLKTPVSCGIIKPDDKGRVKIRVRPEGPVRQMKAFAISIEKAGGGKTPQGVIFLVGS